MPAAKTTTRGKAASAPVARPPRRPQLRLKREDRERQIVEEAVRYFADVGFSGDTRELARRLHITQPLLFRYFPSKEALIERAFQEVSTSRWNPFWEEMLADRSRPLKERLLAFYKDYSRIILTREWVRILLFSGLRGNEINRRYLRLVRERIYVPILAQLREHLGLPSLAKVPPKEMEIETIRVLNEKIFYYGVRKRLHRKR
ncbi:MAG: TetR/AcrR family transcriptional regulator [Burkholderiales bacterium]|nr:TetR/AcrR family transcriptional regulator [Burkholderiales bacterium]